MELLTPQEKIEQLNEDIIKSIINSVVWEYNNRGFPCIQLTYGSKKLNVRIDASGDFVTYLFQHSNERCAHETTYLFVAAKRIMQMIVNQEQQELKYYQMSLTETMRLWMISVSEHIFEAQPEDYGYLATLEKIFTPESDLNN